MSLQTLQGRHLMFNKLKHPKISLLKIWQIDVSFLSVCPLVYDNIVFITWQSVVGSCHGPILLSRRGQTDKNWYQYIFYDDRNKKGFILFLREKEIIFRQFSSNGCHNNPCTVHWLWTSLIQIASVENQFLILKVKPRSGIWIHFLHKLRFYMPVLLMRTKTSQSVHEKSPVVVKLNTYLVTMC